MRHPGYRRARTTGRAAVVAGVLLLTATACALGADLRVDVSPARAFALSGGEVRFVADVRLDGEVVDEAEVMWSVVGTGIGNIDGVGTFTAGGTPGRGIVRAVARVGDEEASGHAVIEVGAEAPSRLGVRIEPARATLQAGEERRFAATITDPASGEPVEADVTWVTIPEDIGAIDASGLFVAGAAEGIGRIAARARVGGREGVGHAAVVVGATLGSGVRVRVTPVRAVVSPGDEQTFEASVVDESGLAVDAAVEWDVLPRGIGAIDASGVFTGGPDASAGRVVASVATDEGVARGLANIEVRPDAQGSVALRLRPREAAVAPGGDVMFDCLVLGPDGEELDVPVEWSVRPEWIGTITSDGFFIASESFPEASVNGFWTGTVIATLSGVASDAARVVVHEIGAANRLRITPARAVVRPGVEFDLECDVVGPGDPGPWTVEWSVFPDELGTISPDGVLVANPAFADPASGLFGPREGVVAARATLGDGSVLTSRAHVSVRLPGLPLRIDVRPALAVVPPGGSRAFTATIIGPDGNVSDLPVRWSVTPPAIGSVAQDGLFTAAEMNIDANAWNRPHGLVVAEMRLGNGAVYRGAAAVVIDLPDPDVVVRVSPKAVTVDLGETVSFQAEVSTVDGTPLNLPVQWRSSDTVIGTVSPDGVFTAAGTVPPGHSRRVTVTAGVEYQGRVYWDVASVRVRP
jgi:hypothetical protein